MWVEMNYSLLQPVVMLERLPDEVIESHVESYEYSKWAAGKLVHDEKCYPSWSWYVAENKSTKWDRSPVPPGKDQSSSVAGNFKLTSLYENAEKQALFRTTCTSKNNVRCSKCGVLFLKTKATAMCLNCRPKAPAMEKIKKQWKQMSINSYNLPKQRAHMVINDKSEETNLQTNAKRIELIKYPKKRKWPEEKHYNNDDKCGFKSLESKVTKRIRNWDGSFTHANKLTPINKQNSQRISWDSSSKIFKNDDMLPVKKTNSSLHNKKSNILENHNWIRDQKGNGTNKCHLLVDKIKTTLPKKEGTFMNFQKRAIIKNEKSYQKIVNLDHKTRKEKDDDLCMQTLERTDIHERIKINSGEIQPKHSPSQQKGLRTNEVEWKKYQKSSHSENFNTNKNSWRNEEVSYTVRSDCINEVNPNSKKVMDVGCSQGNKIGECLQPRNTVNVETQQDKKQALESFSCKNSNQNEDLKHNVKMKESDKKVDECRSTTTKVILNVDRNKIMFTQAVGSCEKRGVEVKDVRNGLLLMTFGDDEDIISETEEPLVKCQIPEEGVCGTFQEGNTDMHYYNDNLQHLEDQEPNCEVKNNCVKLGDKFKPVLHCDNRIKKSLTPESVKDFEMGKGNLKKSVGKRTVKVPEVKDDHGHLQLISHSSSQNSISNLKDPKIIQHVTFHDETDKQYGKFPANSKVMSQSESAESISSYEKSVPLVENVNLNKKKLTTLKEEIVNFWKEGSTMITPLDELDCLTVASIVDLDCGPERAMNLFRFKLLQNVCLLKKLAIAEQNREIPAEVVKKNKNMILSAITKLLFSVRLVRMSKDDSQSTHQENVQSNLSCNSHYSDHVSVGTEVSSAIDIINSQLSSKECELSLDDQNQNQQLVESLHECLGFESARNPYNSGKKSIEYDFVPLSSSAHQTSSFNYEQQLQNINIVPTDKKNPEASPKNSAKQQLFHLSSGQNSFGTRVNEVSEKCSTNGQASSQTKTLMKKTTELPQGVTHSNIKLGQQLHDSNVAPELTPSSKTSGSLYENHFESILRKQSDETISKLAQGELCSKQPTEMSAQKKQDIETNLTQELNLIKSYLAQQFLKSIQKPHQDVEPSELSHQSLDTDFVGMSHQHSKLSENPHMNHSLTCESQLQQLGIESPNPNIIQQPRLNSNSCNQQHVMFSNQQHYKDSTSATCYRLAPKRVFSQHQLQQIAALTFTQGHSSKVTSEEPSDVGSSQVHQQLSYPKKDHESQYVQESITTSTQQHWDKKTELSQQERSIKCTLNQVSATSVPSYPFTALLQKNSLNIANSTISPALGHKQMLLPTIRLVPDENIPSYSNLRPVLQVPNKPFYQRILSNSRNSVSPESERTSVSSCTSGDTCNSPVLENDLQSKQCIDDLNPTLVSPISHNIGHWTKNIGQQSEPESITYDLQLGRMNMPLCPPYSLQQNFPELTNVICTPKNQYFSKAFTYHQVGSSNPTVPRSGLVPCATRVPMPNITSPSSTSFMIHSGIKESSLLPLSQCMLCGKQAKNVCSACSKVSYCGEACAKMYWTMKHFQECERLQS
ncbi:uncharacterized protein LOC106467831 isoform X2 [Limulus polyphemus]|uniref:Uncharacterized protein LOC106467831 isoform X2 n=1 Tax=Limulus polyphemus TaxID=6850 RepID=A0ABM1BK96_LIMPO|nr:uncharacterized protein LOC106467831 isoform X2 [Limulus polyphemus]